MAEDLLAQAREQAERSSPPVRAAALLHIARVETAFDRDAARHTFEQALSAARQLPGMDGPLLLEQAQLFAAAVAPDLLPKIPEATGFPQHFLEERLCRIMLEHGHVQEAVSRLMERGESLGFPFGMVPALMQRAGDEAMRLALLRRAIQAWRSAPEAHIADHRFLWLFRSQWKVLPAEEATAVVGELVRAILDRPDSETRATFDAEESVAITSKRAFGLFQVLGILRRLDPPLAERVIAEQEQLAAAARRYPNGMDSVFEEAAARRSTCDQSGGGFAGNPRDFPFMQALMQGSPDGGFGPAQEHALERYAEDAAPGSPNQAPREFWPSTAAFRSILYAAGKRFGSGRGCVSRSHSRCRSAPLCANRTGCGPGRIAGDARNPTGAARPCAKPGLRAESKSRLKHGGGREVPY